MPPLTMDGLLNLQVLFCALASPAHYPRPFLSEREVFCGPDCQTLIEGDSVLTLATPPGDFDMAALVARLPAHQKPDLIVIKADATRRNLARNLDLIPCPKLLLVGDTHHLEAPIGSLIRYATTECFDAIILDHTRHHAHFFLEAGFDRVCWIPALDYALRHRSIEPSSSHDLTFVGQIGAFHPYRRHVLSEVVRAGLPLQTLRGTPEEAADLYAASAITLNCSLNGDLNLRVFEALGAGGFLITDALSPQAGLERLFTPGRHLVTYRSPGELVELIRHYLSHPEEALAIRRAGQAHLLDSQSPAIKRAQLYGLLEGGPIDPALQLEDRSAATPLPARGQMLRHRITAYEAVQHLHRHATHVTVLAGPDDPLDLASAVIDLPRVTVQAPDRLSSDVLPLPQAEEDDRLVERRVVVLSWASGQGGVEERIDRRLADAAAEFAVVAGPGWAAQQAAARRLAAWGFSPDKGTAGLYRCTDRLRFTERSIRLAQSGHSSPQAGARLTALVADATDTDQAMAAARLAQMLGDAGLLERAVQRCVALDRNHDDGLRVLAALAEATGRSTDAWILTAERLRARGLPVEAPAALPGAPDLALLEQKATGDARLAQYRALITPTAQPTEAPRRILVVTNLFPPQEFGGYGRKLWEFSADLLRRGHDVRILTADAPDLTRPGMAGTQDLEERVERGLALHGFWQDGRAFNFDDRERCIAILRANVARVLEAVRRQGSEVCLVGNLDLIGAHCLTPLTQQGIPVLHCLGNQHPGYGPAEAPRSPLYRPGPASRWVEARLAEEGYDFPETALLYPGARVDYFYRPVLPDLDRLRIVFAGLYVAYKGPQVLLNALALLHRAGLDFECVMAGEGADAGLLERSQAFCQTQGLAGKVRFQGFLDRRGLFDLFARSNVLVFPSVFQEPFGISQVEAMAAGLTVMTSATGGSGEIVRHGVDGLHFASEDPADLAAKLRSLLDDRAGWARLAQAGRARAFAFTVGGSVDRIEAIFTELLARRDRRGPPLPAAPDLTGLCEDAGLMTALLGEGCDLHSLRQAVERLDSGRWIRPSHPQAVAAVRAALAAAPPSSIDRAARSLAALLLAPPYAWTGLAPLADMPVFACERYAAMLLAAPSLFQETGEAERYADHMVTALPTLAQALEAESDAARKSAALRGATAASLVPLYFNERNVAPALRARSALYRAFLRSHGLEPDWTPPPRSDGPLRIGILVSALVPRPESFAVLPLIMHPPQGAELIVYALARTGHALEQAVTDNGARFSVLPEALNQQLAALRAEELDILFFASNIAAVLNSSSALACCRAARVQVSSVASVVTSGSPCVDYYVSGALNERAADAESHYSETLIRLPGLAHCFLDPGEEQEPLDQAAIRAQLGLPAEAVVFGSTANVNKIIPDLQEVWSAILARVPGSVLLLMPYGPHWNHSYPEALFRDSFLQRLRAAGVADDRLVILSERGWDRHDVRRALGAADLYLDSFPFSGSTSLIEPMEAGLPILCRAGATFRSQMGAAMLTDLGCPELIAASDADYIDKAVRLASDPAARRAAAAQVSAGFARPPRFKDAAGYAAALYQAMTMMVRRTLELTE
ncbi:glycosyltransferase family protein [Azospirillum endophyticum]